jgi:uncharacterized protein (DUF302 family)
MNNQKPLDRRSAAIQIDAPSEETPMFKLQSTLILALCAGLSAHALAQAPAAPYTGNPYLQNVPPPAPVQLPNLMPLLAPAMPAVIPGMPKGTGAITSVPPWTMSVSPTPEDKKKFMKTMLPQLNSMGLNLRDIMNFMTTKYQAKDGVSFDDAVESMKLRANQLNLKLVGHSPMIKDIQAVLGDTSTPRMEVFHFCDIEAGREIMKLVPESIVYLPCRIAVMEDAQKKVWLLTLDWDTAWMDGVNSASMGVSPEMTVLAKKIRDNMDNVMRAAAAGDL